LVWPTNGKIVLQRRTAHALQTFREQGLGAKARVEVQHC